MAHWIEDRIQTESGLDLLTESGASIIRDVIGVSGEITAQGSAGSVAATGIIRDAPQPEIPAGAGWLKPVQITRILFGTVESRGQTGTSNAAGAVRLAGGVRLKSVSPSIDLAGDLRLSATGDLHGKIGDLQIAARLRLSGLLHQYGFSGISTANAKLHIKGVIECKALSGLVCSNGFIEDELALLLALLD